MPTKPDAVFHYEVEKSGDGSAGTITTITCHGRLVSENSGQIKDLVKPLIPQVGASCSTSPTWPIWTAPDWEPW
jgi:hypothetical protein